MNKYLTICIGILAFIGTAFASAPDIKWRKAFGDMTGMGDGLQADDGSYIVTGAYNNTYTNTISLMKLDSLGNREWYKSYCGGTGYSIIKSKDNGYVITGIYGSAYVDYSIASLLKTDSSGNEKWFKTFGDSSISYAFGYSVKQTRDGGYIVTGGKDSSDASNPDVWLIKTDSLGNKKWDKTFKDSVGGYDVGYDVQQSPDDGYAVAGNYDWSSIWLIKTDSLGNEKWDKTYGGSLSVGACILLSNDNGYIIGGDSAYKAYLIKTDSLGNKVWTKAYDGGRPNDLQRTSDDGYIITTSGSKIIRTDSLGDTIWTKTVEDTFVHWGVFGKQSRDGGYIIGGEHYNMQGDYDSCWVLKLNSDLGTEERELIAESKELKVSPNPFTQTTAIKQLSNQVIKGFNIQIYDLSGRVVEEINDNIIGKDLFPGVYFLKAKNYNPVKLIKLR